MGATAAVSALVITAATSAYTIHEQKQQAEKAQDAADAAARDAKKTANQIALPNTQAFAANVQQSEQRAASAGGTLSNKGQIAIGDAAGAPKKTLLGS